MTWITVFFTILVLTFLIVQDVAGRESRMERLEVLDRQRMR